MLTISLDDSKNLVIWLLYAALFVYNMLDAWHTELALAAGLREINPFMEWIIYTFGNQGMYLFKLTGLLVLFILLVVVTTRKETL